MNKGASETEIADVEVRMNAVFPAVFKAFLSCTNGVSIGGGVLIYGTEELAERNETWEVAEYAQGFVAIGDDGGGRVLLMKQQPDEKQVWMADAGDMNPGHAEVITEDFNEWVKQGCAVAPDLDTIANPSERCRILLVRMPEGKMNDLLEMKKVFGLKTSAADLLKGTRNLPYVVTEGISSSKAKKLIEKLGPAGRALKIEPANE